MEYQADSNSTRVSYLLSGTCGVKVVIFLDNVSFCFSNKTE